MKRINILFIVTSFLILSACSKLAISDVPESEVDVVSFSAANFVYQGGTRTNINTSDASFTWAVDDTVGIYPNAGSQIYFAMINGAGTNTATFDGGGWAFRSGATYYSYYPFIADFYLDRACIPVSFVGQKQNGPNDFSHFGKFDFMYTGPTQVSNNSLSFYYKHLICVIQINAKLPAGTYRQVTLSASEPVFVKKGHFSLIDENPAIIGDELSKELSIALDNVTLNEETEIKLYIVSAPIDLSGKTMTVSVIDSEKKQLDCVKGPLPYAFEAFNFYPLGCRSWTEVPQSVGLIIDDWGDGGSISGGAE